MALKVLLADPNPTTQKVVELTLQEGDAELVCARNGNEALAKAESFLPEVILFSETLDDMDASEFHRQLMARPLLRDIPSIVLLSGQDVNHRQLDEWGITNRLEKPFEANELLDAIEHALSVEIVVERDPAPKEEAEIVPEESDVKEEAAREPTTAPSEEEEGPVLQIEPEPGEDLKVAWEEAEKRMEKISDEVDFSASLKALSDEVFQQTPEKDVSGIHQDNTLRDRPDGKLESGSEEDLMTRTEDIAPQNVDISGAIDGFAEGLTEIKETARLEKLKRFGHNLGEYLAEALRQNIDENLERAFNESLEKAIEEIKPELLETARLQLERFLPNMAELVIRQEIERLKEKMRQEGGDSSDAPA
jgi:CheY-like chemotaxis protein